MHSTAFTTGNQHGMITFVPVLTVYAHDAGVGNTAAVVPIPTLTALLEGITCRQVWTASTKTHQTLQPHGVAPPLLCCG